MVPLPGVAATLKGVMGPPWQIRWVVLIGCVVIMGFSFTVTVTSFVNEQPSELVLVRVYKVVAVGEAVTVVPVVALKPVAGLHV